mgnify:FL=1
MTVAVQADFIPSEQDAVDPAKIRYSKKRQAHWDRVSSQKVNPERLGAFYQKLLHHYFTFLVPPDLKILELGCGTGDLLAALKPSVGVGVDFSCEMIRLARENHSDLTFFQADVHEFEYDDTYDVIILSDLVNDLWDVQAIFEGLKDCCQSGTRIIINYYNNLWRIPLGVVKRLGLGSDTLEQNWFAPHDVENLLELAGFEIVKSFGGILLPLHFKWLSHFFNRYLVHFPPFRWFALTNFVIARPVETLNQPESGKKPSVSVIVAARNEAGNIDNILKRFPDFGTDSELVFVEGNSTDNTYEAIQETMALYPDIRCSLYKQPGKGKGDAVRVGFEKASGDVLMILDADLTVPPEDLPRFYDALASGKGEFINGVRLVYPMEDQAMRFFNILGNKFFSLVFSWLLGQQIKDTLCGTKVLRKSHYNLITKNRSYFGDFDPFGDFDLLFGAAKLNLKIAEMPIRYRERVYGDTNINRWSHGWLLLRMVVFAAKRIKFI